MKGKVAQCDSCSAPRRGKLQTSKEAITRPGFIHTQRCPAHTKTLQAEKKNWSWKENLNLKSFDQGRHLLQKVGSNYFRNLPNGRLCFTFIFPPLHWTLIERGGMVFDLLALAGYPLPSPLGSSYPGLGRWAPPIGAEHHQLRPIRRRLA